MTTAEHIRHALLRTLYGTRTVRVAGSFLARAAQRDCGCEADAANAEIEFLVSADYATVIPDPMGSTKYYQISAAGILAYERAQ